MTSGWLSRKAAWGKSEEKETIVPLKKKNQTQMRNIQFKPRELTSTRSVTPESDRSAQRWQVTALTTGISDVSGEYSGLSTFIRTFWRIHETQAASVMSRSSTNSLLTFTGNSKMQLATTSLFTLKFWFLFETKWTGKKKWNRSCDNYSRKRQEKKHESGLLIWCSPSPCFRSLLPHFPSDSSVPLTCCVQELH